MSIEVIASDKAPEQDELWGLALKTQDIDATHARLTTSGIEVSEIRRSQTRYPGLYSKVPYTGRANPTHSASVDRTPLSSHSASLERQRGGSTRVANEGRIGTRERSEPVTYRQLNQPK